MERLKILKETTHKAKKTHQCGFCQEKILKTEMYKYFFLANDNDFFEWRSHFHCFEVAEILKEDGYISFCSDKFERDVKYHLSYRLDLDKFKNHNIRDLAYFLLLEIEEDEEE